MTWTETCDSVPEEGVLVLVWNATDDNADIASCIDQDSRLWETQSGDHIEADYWMPLPERP